MIIGTHGLSLGFLFGWVILVLAGFIGSMMVMIGMFEELPGIVRDAAARSFIHRT
jgi:hypothetical protein